MAYMAQLDNNNVVTRVLSVSNNDCPDPAPQNEAQGSAFLESLGLGGNWKQTSYNGNFRVRYAGVGYTYDAERDAFIAPKPFDSWVFDEELVGWIAPVAYPSEGGPYTWDEETLSWVAVSAG
jgi:hypothetical protein